MKTSHSKLFSVTFILLAIVMMGVNVSAFSWTNDIVSYWKLDNNDLTDSVRSNHGVNFGSTNSTGIIISGRDISVTSNITVPYDDTLRFNESDFSVNFWLKPDITDGNIMGKTNSGTPYGWSLSLSSSGVTYRGNSGGGTCTTATDVVDVDFHMVTIRRMNTSATGVELFIDGVYKDSCTGNDNFNDTQDLIFGDLKYNTNYDGKLDEIGIWNRSLTDADITELYNSGAGLSYEGATPSEGITVTLSSPTNDSLISDVGENFTATYVTDAIALKNVTYYIWMTNGTSINVTTVAMNPVVSNSSTEYIDNFGLGDYLWNVKATGENVTGTFSFFATDNRSFSGVPFSKTSESWINPTIEGSTDLFTVNISLRSGFRISEIRFFYNETSYEADYTEYATDTFFVTRTHNIPLVSADTNVTFYWNVTLETGGAIASETENQTIKNLVIDNCTSGTFVLFNFTMVDEDTQTFLVGATENTSLDIDLILTSLTNGYLGLNYSGTYDDTNPSAVCANIDLANSVFRADALIEYTADNKFVEYYNIQNYRLTNTTDNQNITLYNLNSSKGQEFKITYKDSNFNLVPGAIIQIQRKYIDEGVFKTVEIPMISSAGYTIAHLLRNDAVYNLVVLKDGVTLDSFTNIVADCQNPSLTQCVININSFSSSVNPESFSDVGDFSATLTYNATTRVITSIFVIPSGVASTTTLNVTLIDGLGTTAVCADSLFAAGGTLTCTVPVSFGNSTVVAQVYNSGNLKIQRTIRLGDDTSRIYGNSLVFISLTIILLIIGMSITDNPMILGVMLIFGVVILTVLNMINSYGWIGPGATILWLVVAIIIILIKGSNRQ